MLRHGSRPYPSKNGNNYNCKHLLKDHQNPEVKQNLITSDLENIYHVTSYDCLFVQTENRKWGTEFTYDDFRLERFSHDVVLPYMLEVVKYTKLIMKQ